MSPFSESSEPKQQSSTTLSRFVYETHYYDEFVVNGSNEQACKEKEMEKYLDDWQKRWDQMVKKADNGATEGK